MLAPDLADVLAECAGILACSGPALFGGAGSVARMLGRGRIVTMLVALAVAGGACSSSPSAHKRSATTTVPPTTASVPAGTPVSTTTPATTVPGNGSPAPQDIVPTAATESDLEAAYASYMHDPPQDIGGTEQGSVHEAYVPPSATYWALARFLPSDNASQQTIVSMQDGGNIGVFDKSANGTWTMLTKGTTPFCPSRTPLPAEVRALWGLEDPPQCG